VGTKIPYDIETTPLQVRTWGDDDESVLWMKFYDDADKAFTFSFVFNNFSIWLNPDCSDSKSHNFYTLPIVVI